MNDINETLRNAREPIIISILEDRDTPEAYKGGYEIDKAG